MEKIRKEYFETRMGIQPTHMNNIDTYSLGRVLRYAHSATSTQKTGNMSYGLNKKEGRRYVNDAFKTSIPHWTLIILTPIGRIFS